MNKSFIAPDLRNIPPELRKLARWVVWRAVGAPGEKPRKVPYMCGRRDSTASSTDPATWSSFAQAERAYSDGKYTGIGIVLNGDGLVGVDIDHCVTNGKPSAEAMALLTKMGAGYIEISPSGTGLRAIGYGESLDVGVNGLLDGLKAEFYSTERYLTLTGKTIKAGPIVQLRDFVTIAESFRTVKTTKVNQETGQIEQTPPDERHAALVKSILTGDVYHDSLRDLAASMTATGMQAGAVVNHLRGLMDASAGPHDERWAARRASIPGLVSSAGVRFAPLPDEDFDTMLVQATDKLSNEVAKETVPDAPEGDTKASSKTAAAYKLLTATDLHALPSLRWRIRDVLPENGLGMILGASTAGKTFVGLDMAAHIAMGRDWYGFKVNAAPVVYICLEGERGVQRRIKAWEMHHGESLPDHFRFVLQPFNMMNLQNVADLAAAVLAAGGRDGVIIIDTLNRATPGGDENSSVDMGNVIAAAKNLQSATNSMVVLVHHKGKNDAAGARGHSSLYAALDAAIAVNRTERGRSWSTDPAQGGKSKDGEAISKGFELKTVHLGLDDDALPVDSAVVVPCDDVADRGRPLTKAQQDAMQAYYDVAGEQGTLNAAGEFSGLHIDAWRSAFYTTSTADTTEAKKKSFQRVRYDLVKLGRVSVVNDVYQLGADSSFRETEFADSLREKQEQSREVLPTTGTRDMPGHLRDSVPAISVS